MQSCIAGSTAGKKLERFYGHHRSDDTRNRRKHTITGTILERLVCFGVQTSITRRCVIVRPENGELALQANCCSRDQVASGRDAGVVHLEARREIIAAIEDDISLAN